MIIIYFVNKHRRTSLEDIEDEDEIEEYESDENTDDQKKVKEIRFDTKNRSRDGC